MSDDLNRPAENPDTAQPEPPEQDLQNPQPVTEEGFWKVFRQFAFTAGLFAGGGALVTCIGVMPTVGSTRSAKLEWQRRQQQAAEALQHDRQLQHEAARGAAPDGEAESHDGNGK